MTGAVQVSDEAVSGKEPYQIASIVAAFAGDKNFDVIFTGMQSQDRGSGQVGVLIAEMLGMPSVTTVVDFNFEGGSVTAKRELEGGIKAMVMVATPALFTCQLGLNTPRYPTLPNIMKAKKKELLSIPVGDLLKVEPRQQTAALYFPEKKGGGLVLEGEVGDLADQLVRILKEKTTVLS